MDRSIRRPCLLGPTSKINQILGFDSALFGPVLYIIMVQDYGASVSGTRLAGQEWAALLMGHGNACAEAMNI